MYRIKKIIILSLLPFFGFSQGMNIELLETASGAGFIPYTDTAGYQGYVLLADLLATLGTGGAANADSLGGLAPSYYLNFNNLINTPNITNQIFAVSNVTGSGIAIDTSGAALELSEFGGRVEYKGKANENIYIRSEQNKIYFGLIEGAGSELDSDRLDGESGEFYTNWNNLTNVPSGFSDNIDDNTQLTTEQVQDAIGGMVSGNTETGITVTYDDVGDEFDFTVANQSWNQITNKPSLFVSAWSIISDIPTGFSDGIDNNNTYTASNGIQLVGSVFQMQIDGLATEIGLSTSDYIPIFDVSQNTENKTTLATLQSLIDTDTDTQLSESQVDSYANNNGYLTGVGIGLDIIGTTINLDFSEFSVDNTLDGNSYFTFDEFGTHKRTSFTTLKTLIDTDTNTQLSEAQVDSYVSNNGYLTSATNNYVSGMAITGTTTKQITLSRLGLSSIFASFTDNNTQLSEAQVDSYVSNNGYITSDANNYPTGLFFSTPSNTLTITRNGLSSVQTNLSTIQADWSNLQNIPGGFSDGVDNAYTIGYQDVTGGNDPNLYSLTNLDELQVSIYDTGTGQSQLFFPNPSSTYRGKKVQVSYYGSGSYKITSSIPNSHIMYKGSVGSVLITDKSMSYAVCTKLGSGSSYYWQVFKSN